jgi:hypothetical protein
VESLTDAERSELPLLVKLSADERSHRDPKLSLALNVS